MRGLLDVDRASKARCGGSRWRAWMASASGDGTGGGLGEGAVSGRSPSWRNSIAKEVRDGGRAGEWFVGRAELSAPVDECW
jgi:hypothetical protein